MPFSGASSPSGTVEAAQNSKYASSITTGMWAGTFSRNARIWLSVTAGPVGLLGVQTRIRRVRSVMAAAMASRSCEPSGRFGTCTLRAPIMPTRIGYASKERQA